MNRGWDEKQEKGSTGIHPTFITEKLFVATDIADYRRCARHIPLVRRLAYFETNAQ